MEQQERRMKLLLRQVVDLQAQASKIISGNNSSELIANFSKYSAEVQEFVMERVENKDLKDCVKGIEVVDYSKVEYKLWHFLLLPLWFLFVYKEVVRRKEAVEKINIIRGQYANLELLINQHLNSLYREG